MTNEAVAGRPWLVPVRLDPEADREEWIAERMNGIGGSDAAAIVDESPFKSRIDVFMERTAGVVSFLDNQRTEVGRLLEPVVIDWFAAGPPRWPRDGSPLRIVKPPSVYHRDRTWQRGSADGVGYYPEVVAHLADGVDLLSSSVSPSFLLEVKTHGWFAGRAYDAIGDDGTPVGVPTDKRIQCAWYMALWNVDLTYLAALVDTHIRRTYVIHRDRQLEDMLLEVVDRFWRRYILTGEPPPPDGTHGYSKYLRGRFRKHSAQLVASTPVVDQAIQALLAIKAEAKRLDKDRELAEQVIKRAIGETLGIRSPFGVATWKNQASGKLREKEARAELYKVAGWTDDEIDQFEDRLKEPDHRVLRISKR